MPGMRYALHSPAVKRVSIRTLAFSTFGSAMLALLPTLARRHWQVSAFEFGMLWACFGLGAVLGATLLVPLRQRFSLDALIGFMTGGLALLLFCIARLETASFAFPLMCLAGTAWVSMVSTFGVSMGAASSPWVLSRMLSLYVLAFQGAAAIGSILWGQLAQQFGAPLALSVASVALASTIGLAFLAPMPSPNPQQLQPSHHWPEPPSASTIPVDAPVTVTVEYLINPSGQADFRAAMNGLRSQRLRDGAIAWSLHQSIEEPQRFLELFQLPSWLDHLRQHERVTIADHGQQDLVQQYHVGSNPPAVRHWTGL